MIEQGGGFCSSREKGNSSPFSSLHCAANRLGNGESISACYCYSWGKGPRRFICVYYIHELYANAKTREQCNARAAQCFSNVNYEILTKYASCHKVHWDIHFSPPLICIVELIILPGVVYASRSSFWGLPPSLTPLYDRLLRRDRLATKFHDS